MTRAAIVAAGFALATAWPLPAQTSLIWPVRGAREMVVAANNFEAEAGYRMLLQGGNAVDAGVAAVLAAAVTEQARFGLGGEMPLLLKMAGKPVVAISGVGTAPARATAEYFRNRAPEPWEDPAKMPPIPALGLRAAIVPGVFDGLILALREFGTMSFAQVAAPAIEYTEGFPLGDEFANFLKTHRRVLELWPASRDFFLPAGEPPEPGALFRAPALGRTLRELVAVEKRTRGKRKRKLDAVRDYFYRGPIARRIAAFSQENGGLLGYQDLASYRAELDEPRSTSYRGYEIFKAGFWTQGPVMLQALNILEGFDLKAMGHNTPEYLHTLVEAMKLAFADRDAYYGDPKFAAVPEAVLLSKEYAAERRRLIDPRRASLEHRPGPIAGPVLPASANGVSPDQDTTSVNVVDRFGNVFCATPSGAWLPSVIAGDTGIPLSTRLQSFVLTPGHPNELKPGKRPRVTLTPTIVLQDGRPVLLISSPGGDNQDQALIQVLLNIIEFGMTPQEAVEAPRFQSAHYYSSFAFHEFTPGRLGLEARIPKETADRLAAMGHAVHVQGPWGNSSAPAVILIRDGVLEAGMDPRRGRFAFGR
ncbi:MAG TPA: gamma-glutamyltransferase family protein [Bryobacteraceae bacterium]|nr:gamma-glutamyltransferase family protein [Bryobacteraceae bacterium]